MKTICVILLLLTGCAGVQTRKAFKFSARQRGELAMYVLEKIASDNRAAHLPPQQVSDEELNMVIDEMEKNASFKNKSTSEIVQQLRI